MNPTIRSPLAAALALGTSLALSVTAFAQQQTQQDLQDAAMRDHQQIQSDAATPAQPAASGQSQQSWESLDADRDGAISKQEANSSPGLTQIFGQADSDTDGKLTSEEYKAFIVSHYGGGAGQ